MSQPTREPTSTSTPIPTPTPTATSTATTTATSTSSTPLSLAAQKSLVRQKVWTTLRTVALPDSRFHHDYAEFIADFDGSSAATTSLLSHPAFAAAKVVFITPDNCLEELRYEALKAGKTVLVTTYAIRRGFWLLDPQRIPAARWEYASTLDGMERAGLGARSITLAQMRREGLRIDVMVTGTGAVNTAGIRFGKGHGFFDLEWAMLYSVGVVGVQTVTVCVVHDCQVLDEELRPEAWDTVCDVLVTPTRVLEVEGVVKPTGGILWELLEGNMLADIPPLRELKEMGL